MQVDVDCVVRLGEKLQKEDPTPEIFDDVQRNVRSALIGWLLCHTHTHTHPSQLGVDCFLCLFLSQVYDMMLRDERYYPSFKQSPLYVRMLAELDMLKEPSYRGSDDGDGESFNGSPTGSINLVRAAPP